MTQAKVPLCQRFLLLKRRFEEPVTGLLSVQSSILPMLCTALGASGTVLWSGLLLESRESAITPTELELGGGVPRILPVRRGRCDSLVTDSLHAALSLGRRYP